MQSELIGCASEAGVGRVSRGDLQEVYDCSELNPYAIPEVVDDGCVVEGS